MVVLVAVVVGTLPKVVRDVVVMLALEVLLGPAVNVNRRSTRAGLYVTVVFVVIEIPNMDTVAATVPPKAFVTEPFSVK